MIVEGWVEVNWHSQNRVRLAALGYKKPESGNKLLINVEHLLPSSKVKVYLQCDHCSAVKLGHRNNHQANGYYCIKCNRINLRTPLSEVRQAFIDKGYTPLFTEY